MTSLDDFVEGRLSDALLQAGFRRRKLKYSLSRQNTAIVQFVTHPLPEPWLGFQLDWDVVPSASVDFYRERTGARGPRIGWGIFAGRIIAPAQYTLYQADDEDVWAPRIPELLAPAQTTILEIFSRLIPWLAGATDPDVLHRTLSEGRTFGFGGPAGTPASGPVEEYVAVNIDTAPVGELNWRLRTLEREGRHPEWVTWWRERLESRNQV